MKRFTSTFLISVIVLICASGQVWADDADNVMKKMQKKYKDTKTIRIHFREISKFSLTNTTSEVSGILQMEGKKRFRLDYEDQLILNNAETLWRYNKLDNQVLIDHAKVDEQEAMLNNLVFDMRDHYFGKILRESKENGGKVFELKLTPKSSDHSFFTSVRLKVREDSWEIQEVIYLDYNDNETKFLVEKVEFNPAFTTETFSFTPPAGTNVVDLRF